MSDTPLVVPIHCDALVVNTEVHERDDFRRWQFNYMALSDFKSPEPEALDGNADKPALGVHLHWTLPRGLRHGRQNRLTGAIEYPLVPNRWLIVRLSGTQTRQVKAWVLESDCPFSKKVSEQQWQDSAQSSLYLADPKLIEMWKNSSDEFRKVGSESIDPKPEGVPTKNIGVRFPLESWQERAPKTMFLTAVGPSNPVFSGYYPHNIGVFSFHDDVAGIENDTLSYFVLGWYSDPDQDILAPNKRGALSYDDLLKQLNWTVTSSNKVQATTSLYQAAVFSVQWNPAAPDKDPLQIIRDSGKLNVSIGNTTIDAFTTLISSQIKDPQKTELLRALQYDCLDLLNQVSGEALLDERARRAWFSTKPGGYTWTIVAKHGEDGDGSAAATLTLSEKKWLAQLNQDQSALDEALNKLFSLQWDLNAAWYKQKYLLANYPPELSFARPENAPLDAAFTDALDPEKPGSLISQVIKQIEAVKAAMAKVPQPGQTSVTNGRTAAANAQDAFQQAIEKFAQQKGLSPSSSLKAIAAPRFSQANNPVILIAGVEPSKAATSNEALQARLTTHLVTGFRCGSGIIDVTSVDKAGLALLNPSALPSAVPSLFNEFVLLDPSSAAALAAAAGLSVEEVSRVISQHSSSDYQGTLLGLNLNSWTQPWNPMFVEWKVKFFDVPYKTDGHQHWVFDGKDYRLASQGTPDEGRVVGGISLLSPHMQSVFGSRLDDFTKKYGAKPEFDAKIGEIHDWKLLAQELTGFNESLALRDSRAYRRPTEHDMISIDNQQEPLADLLGYTLDSPGNFTLPAPYRGQVQSMPYLPNGPVIPFHGVRQGQLYFEALTLYDKFGRKLKIIEPSGNSGLRDFMNFPLLIDAALRPEKKPKLEASSVVQLPPRILQHSRLDFSLVDAKDDHKRVDCDPTANPICGWVLPNHLDRSLLVYAPDGTSLGEFRLIETPDGKKSGEWQAPPHSAIKTLDEVATFAPHLHQMLIGMRNAKLGDGEANFQALLSVIDTTLWTIDPLGNRSDQNLSVLIGRPLALVRAQLKFQLDGHPWSDTGWAATFKTDEPEFVTYPYAIRIGDQATRQDGVIGYYLSDDYTKLNTVACLDTATEQSYITPIGPIGKVGGGNYIEQSFNNASPTYLTLLMDPRASAHAVTGILPVKQLTIPPHFLEAPLANMEATFRMGPVLTLIQPTPPQDGQPPALPSAITYPLPAERNGSWSWWEKNADSDPWTGYDLIAATPNAQLKSIPATLREGFFQLVADLKEKQK